MHFRKEEDLQLPALDAAPEELVCLGDVGCPDFAALRRRVSASNGGPCGPIAAPCQGDAILSLPRDPLSSGYGSSFESHR